MAETIHSVEDHEFDALRDRVHRVVRRRRDAPGRHRRWLIRRALLVADLFALFVAFALATAVSGAGDSAGRLSSSREILIFIASLPAWVILAHAYHLYERDGQRTGHGTVDDLHGVFHLTTVGAFVFFVGSTLAGLAQPRLIKIAAFVVFAIVLVTVFRAVARHYCRRHDAYVQNAVIVGAGRVGQLVARKLAQHPEFGINVVGFLDCDPRPLRNDLRGARVVGAPNDLRNVIDDYEIERVIVAFDRESDTATLQHIRELADEVLVDVVPRMFDLVGPHAELHTVETVPMIGLSPTRPAWTTRAAKSVLDAAAAITLLVLTLPLFALIALAIKLDSPGPVLFRQQRLGRHQRMFTMLKFRSMHTDTPSEEHQAYIAATASADAELGENGVFKLDRTSEITRVGAWLRRTSLDELPQLLNVLSGDMSMVGPRPCLPYETSHFAPYHFERFDVAPGITGLWQVTSRAHSSFGEALDLDVLYVRNASITLDLKLLFQTPLQVLRPKGTR